MSNRYFIAIIPDKQIEEQITEFKKVISKKYFSQAALQSPAHITLHMPFNLEKKVEKRFLSALEQWKPTLSEFKIDLCGFSSFNSRVIFISVLKNKTLEALRNMTVEFMRSNFQIFNQADDLRAFHPHVTIAFRDLKKKYFNEALNEFSAMNYNASFNCGSIWVLRREENFWMPLREIKFV